MVRFFYLSFCVSEKENKCGDKENKKQTIFFIYLLGFTLTMREDPGSIENLWGDTRYFMEQHPEHILPSNETIMPWITDSEKVDYNMCHLWSNFEIVKSDFLRSKAYQEYFEYLDRKGGFFYERFVILIF